MSTVPTEGGRPFNYGRGSVISYPVVVGGVQTRVVEAGSGDRVMVCLHGTGSRADRWVPAMPALVDAGFHVFSMDFPGHGFADKRPDLTYSAEAFGALVSEVMDALALSEVVLAGTSLGGHVAARVACDRPELARNLVLIGSTGIAPYPDEFKRPPEVVAEASPEAVRRKLEFLVSDPALVSDAWVREESMINSSEGASEALRRTAVFLNDGTNDDLQADRLNELVLERPILLVWGSEDGWTPPQMGREAEASLKSSELVFMEGCGHAPYFENPDEFARVVERHLS